MKYFSAKNLCAFLFSLSVLTFAFANSPVPVFPDFRTGKGEITIEKKFSHFTCKNGMIGYMLDWNYRDRKDQQQFFRSIVIGYQGTIGAEVRMKFSLQGRLQVTDIWVDRDANFVAEEYFSSVTSFKKKYLYPCTFVGADMGIAESEFHEENLKLIH